MRLVPGILAACVALACGAPGVRGALPGDGGSVEPLTIDRILAAPPLAGSPPSSLSWSPDGTRLAFLWSDPERPGRALWLVDADGARLRRATAEGVRVGRFAWMPDGASIVFVRGDELWVTDLGGGTERLAAGVGGARDLRASPDGRHVSFLRDGDHA